MLDNTSKYAQQARQDILDAIRTYTEFYGDIRIVVYKNCKPLSDEIVEIRSGKDCVKIEYDFDNE